MNASISPYKQKIIFVVGNSRSGTTMMASILNKNSKVLAFPEMNFFEQLWDVKSERMLARKGQIRLAETLLKGLPERYLPERSHNEKLSDAKLLTASLPEQVLPPRVYAAFLDYITRSMGKEIACDQTPRNILFAEEILDLYPNAFIINMIRDPRGILPSQKRKPKSQFARYKKTGRIPFWVPIRTWSNYHPVTLGLLWNANINAGLQYQSNARVMHIKYEEFVSDAEKYMLQICGQIGLNYEATMLDIPQVESSFDTTVRQYGIRSDVAERWKTQVGDYAADFFICQFVCRKNMEKIGYPLVKIKVNPLMVIWLWMLLPIKLLLALIFNLSRSQNVFYSIARRLKRAWGKKDSIETIQGI